MCTASILKYITPKILPFSKTSYYIGILKSDRAVIKIENQAPDICSRDLELLVFRLAIIVPKLVTIGVTINAMV